MVKKDWSAMTPDEKREERFKRWLNPAHVKFKDAAAAKALERNFVPVGGKLNVSPP